MAAHSPLNHRATTPPPSARAWALVAVACLAAVAVAVTTSAAEFPRALGAVGAAAGVRSSAASRVRLPVTRACREAGPAAQASEAAGNRRRGVIQGLGKTALLALFAQTAGAGELLEFRKKELAGVDSKLKALSLPDDPMQLDESAQILLAEKTVLETSIEFLEENSLYVGDIVKKIKNEDGKFIQHMVLKVPDLDKEVRYWTKGYGLKVVRERTVGGKRTAFVANSPESLAMEDGGGFALELVETKQPVDVGNGLAYIQMRVGDTPRLSEILKARGTIEFAYGFLQTRSPAGYPVVLYVGEARRDPFELIALRVKDVDVTAHFYEKALGMERIPIRELGKYRSSFGPLYGLGGLLKKDYQKEDVFTPKPPQGSVWMTYGKNENKTMGVLLVPQNSDVDVGAVRIPAGSPINIGDGYGKLAILTNDIYAKKALMEGYTPLKSAKKPEVGFTGEVQAIPEKTKVSVVTDSDGYQTVWVDYDDFEREQPKRPKIESLVEEFEKAMEEANKEANAARQKQAQIDEYEALGDAVRGEGYANV